jgi:hypothetical protein
LGRCRRKERRGTAAWAGAREMSRIPKRKEKKKINLELIFELTKALENYTRRLRWNLDMRILSKIF